jgi:dihydroneopterin aldolase
MSNPGKVSPISAPVARTRWRRLFVRELVLECAIGVHPHERGGRQRVRIDVDLHIADPAAPLGDRISKVVSYDDVIAGIRTLVGEGHVNLVETLAERIADTCLTDPRIDRVRVRVEKLEVLADAAGVGVEIERGYAD